MGGFFQIKFHPGMKFYSFHPGMKLFSYRDEFHPEMRFRLGYMKTHSYFPAVSSSDSFTDI